MSERVALRRVYRLVFLLLSVGALSAEKKTPLRPNDRALQWTAFHKTKKMPIVLLTPKGFVHQKTGQVDASQPTTLWQGDTKITADSIIYAPKNNTVTAKGHVEMMHANGTIVECEGMVVQWDQQAGALSVVRAFSPQRERITAQKVRHNPKKTSLYMGSYTPCDLCQDRLNPLWSVHAREMVLDQEKKCTQYTDAHFSILGTPVFYVPYFDVPTQRASGIVSPNVGINAQLGGYVGIPYFWAISQEHDVTFTPYIMTRSGVMLDAQYRGHTKRHKTMLRGAINPSWYGHSDQRFQEVWAQRSQLGGELDPSMLGDSRGWDEPASNASYLFSTPQVPLSNPENFAFKTDQSTPKLSGFVHGKTECSIDELWRFKAEQWWVSNKTFLETRTFFGNSQATFLPSHATFERFDTRQYFSIRSLNYQGLQPQDRQKNIPYILPELNYAYTSPALWKNSHLSMNGNVLSLYRNQGYTVQRFHMDGQWDWLNTTPWGQKVDVFFRTSGTVYAYTLQDSDYILNKNGSGYVASQAGVTTRWPFMVQHFGQISPVVQIFLAPQNDINQPFIPNEDSQSLIFDRSNFLSHSRFSGYDRLDQSSRINYGMDWSRDGVMGAMHIFLGQSYALNTPNPLLNDVGIRLGKSDYVGQIDWQSDYGDLTYRFRWDAVDGLVRFQEIGWQTGPSWALVSGSYAFGRRNAYTEKPDIQDIPLSQMDYNQLALKVVSKIGSRWTVKGFATHDFDTPEQSAKWMDVGCGFGYQNECVSIDFSIQKSFYSMQDIQPGWTIGFFIRLNAIGELTPSEPRFDHGLGSEW